MKKTVLLLSILAGMFISAQARAQGAYAGIGVMSVSTDNATDFAAVFNGPTGSGDGSANGLKIYGGYVWPSGFGIEGSYYDLGSYEVHAASTKTDEFKVSAFAVSGTHTMPMGTSFDLNLKLGLAFTSADYTCVALCGGIFVNTGKSGVAPLFGAGVGWRVAPNFTLGADLEIFAGVPHSAAGQEVEYDYTAFSLSAQFKF